MRYFDYRKVAGEADIASDKLADLCRMVRRDFPKDEMMYELHVLRACMAIRDGHITLEDALRVETPQQQP